VCHNLQLENVSDQCRSSIISEALEDSIWNPKVNNPATSSLFTIKFDCVFCSKCLGCVYVQREYKSSDHKGVSGNFAYILVFVSILRWCVHCSFKNEVVVHHQFRVAWILDQ
jgi:hypothetical protein